ncbi:transposase [Paenibacillus eucommiae]|uniref:Transposase-like protein n=1 Tax=Paenibacillus eucommiae TaxID=1355755 RepID=A0ABS4J597_9BACL|nr:transposase [Paenibacillus eucommiae]MBP1994997.1 transposase-like protein [Paenibacillus eucommiae]
MKKKLALQISPSTLNIQINTDITSALQKKLHIYAISTDEIFTNNPITSTNQTNNIPSNSILTASIPSTHFPATHISSTRIPHARTPIDSSSDNVPTSSEKVSLISIPSNNVDSDNIYTVNCKFVSAAISKVISTTSIPTNHFPTEEFHLLFKEDQDFENTLFAAKWPNGFRCPRCEHRHAYKISSRRLPLYECSTCRHQSSLTSGTIMEGSRTDLHKWFLTFFLLSHMEQGINAVALSSIIDVTYKTAWLMLTKIRHAMSQADLKIMLSGVVNVNTATYGRPYNPTVFRHPQEHPLLIGSSMNEQGEPLYVKIKKVRKTHMREKCVLRFGTEAFNEKHVDVQTTEITCVTARFSPLRFKGLLGIAKQATRWINNTFHGLGSKHLQSYLDEFCYRLNLNINKRPIFQNLVNLCANSSSISYSMLTIHRSC